MVGNRFCSFLRRLWLILLFFLNIYFADSLEESQESEYLTPVTPLAPETPLLEAEEKSELEALKNRLRELELQNQKKEELLRQFSSQNQELSRKLLELESRVSQ